MNSSSRTALITGGTGGIGLALAHGLLGQGYAVTVTGATEAEVAATPPHADLHAVALDVTQADDVARVVATLPELDVLVNAAGIILRGGREFEIDSFERVIQVNLIGTMRVCLAARAALMARRGAVLNLASMLSFVGGPAVPAYSASKGGIAQLTKSLAAAWAPDGIRVNALAPGWITTELTRPLQEDPARSQALLGRTPMGRWGTPQDLVGAALFLCSEAAGFVTGVVLPVDGGYLAV
ncbi:MAG: SDR family oxidoreductase [Anaerolineales bacterium]|nr:SDR family oxidoreductase [Anaerolineales bacterium]